MYFPPSSYLWGRGGGGLVFSSCFSSSSSSSSSSSFSSSYPHEELIKLSNPTSLHYMFTITLRPPPTGSSPSELPHLPNSLASFSATKKKGHGYLPPWLEKAPRITGLLRPAQAASSSLPLPPKKFFLFFSLVGTSTVQTSNFHTPLHSSPVPSFSLFHHHFLILFIRRLVGARG